MIDILFKFYDSFSDSTKRFEDRVLAAAQLLGQCQSMWFRDLSKALHPLFTSEDLHKTFELYTSFLYEQAEYQLPASQAIALLHEAEARMVDDETRNAMIRLRLGTFLIFRWLDARSPQLGRSVCSYCYADSSYARLRFGTNIQSTWALLKEGNSFLIKSGIPLEEFLKSNEQIVLPNGPRLSIDELRSFLRSQMDAINSVLLEMAADVGIIQARSDFLRNIDLRKSKRPPVSLNDLKEQDDSNSRIYDFLSEIEKTWQIGLLTEQQERITLGFSETGK